ncbi:mitochondrial ribosomal subunit S27-domain-containing protein [Coniochaeta sp. 2T2.1]|nr:mitochondrial ribosomal subunit S27-domain-containing protein [Coniochaeta sp. 2T2.1]
MSVPRARILDLMKVRCQVFSTTYNPEGIRTGNKILRQRLRGPALASYYPRKMSTVQDMVKAFAPYELLVDREEEDDRLDHIIGLKQRGKGAPKKKKAPPSAKDLKNKKK